MLSANEDPSMTSRLAATSVGSPGRAIPPIIARTSGPGEKVPARGQGQHERGRLHGPLGIQGHRRIVARSGQVGTNVPMPRAGRRRWES